MGRGRLAHPHRRKQQRFPLLTWAEQCRRWPPDNCCVHPEVCNRHARSACALAPLAHRLTIIATPAMLLSARARAHPRHHGEVPSTGDRDLLET